jgi:flagellar motor switch protein FliN/FliY
MMSESARDPRRRFRGLEEIPVRVTVRVGGGRLSLARLSALKQGDLVELDRAVGAPFDLTVGEVPLARVEPVAGDEGIGLKLVAVVEDEDDGGD